MPRKTKEQKEIENKNETKKENKKSVAKTASTKTANKKSVTTKTTAKKATTKKATEKKPSAKKETTKKATEKKPSTKKETTKKAATKKNATAKKAATKKSSTKKAVTSTKKTTSRKKVEVVEYYDLPYRYNQTIVKVLAQTPNNLFVYWDISDSDRKKFEEQYGDNFFETTRPILIIHNDTLNYSFEVEINDFANSWYLHINDSKCNYRIELGRRPVIKTEKLNTDYIHITTSNNIETPNDRILFNKDQKIVYFRHVKTGKQTTKNINSISFINNIGKIYNIYDLYKAIYQDENIEELYDLSNPTSGNPSSTSLSSRLR